LLRRCAPRNDEFAGRSRFNSQTATREAPRESPRPALREERSPGEAQRSRAGEGLCPRAQFVERAPHPALSPRRAGRGRRKGRGRRESAAPRSPARCVRVLLGNAAQRNQRARGMPGAQCTRSLVCALVLEYAHEYSQRRHRKHPAFPTQWFYGLYVISPVTGLFCHRRPREKPATLTPASGCQDHTTSPSAWASLV
jgi:hypothetical protein